MLIDELKVSVGLWRPSSTFPNIFSSESTGPIEATFHMKLSWDGGNESLFKRSWSHDLDGRHAHIW